MVKKIMYQKIQHLNKKGFNKSEIANDLNLDRKTVSKYFKMSEDEYRLYLQNQMFRDKLLDIYQDEIIDVYSKNNYHRLNMAAVYDYLEEVFGELPCTEKSLRNYISYLINIGKLELKENVRMYTSVPELPFGQQMQLDFGQYITKSGLKLYIFGALLSSSRYKFSVFQDKPFTTDCVIVHLLDCFEYFGGMPEELVIDQDALMVVSENKGDIIYTKKFGHFIQEMNLKMYVCRKADPETKGKIENFIKYIKNNFLKIRDFNNVQEANNSLKNWLKRRANGKISQATKQFPASLIEEERKHLRSVPKSIFKKDSLIDREERIVNDKSFISVNGSQYSVPVKYRNRSVEIYQTSTHLYIFDIHTGNEIAKHENATISGKKIIDRAHFRETETTSAALKKEVLAMFELSDWKIFVQNNCKTYSRYVRDQCLEARCFSQEGIDNKKLKQALALCIENKTWSFSNLKDTYHFFLQAETSSQPILSVKKIGKQAPVLDVKKRSLESYNNLLSVEAP